MAMSEMCTHSYPVMTSTNWYEAAVLCVTGTAAVKQDRARRNPLGAATAIVLQDQRNWQVFEG